MNIHPIERRLGSLVRTTMASNSSITSFLKKLITDIFLLSSNLEISDTNLGLFPKLITMKNLKINILQIL